MVAVYIVALVRVRRYIIANVNFSSVARSLLNLRTMEVTLAVLLQLRERVIRLTVHLNSTRSTYAATWRAQRICASLLCCIKSSRLTPYTSPTMRSTFSIVVVSFATVSGNAALDPGTPPRLSRAGPLRLTTGNGAPWIKQSRSWRILLQRPRKLDLWTLVLSKIPPSCFEPLFHLTGT